MPYKIMQVLRSQDFSLCTSKGKEIFIMKSRDQSGHRGGLKTRGAEVVQCAGDRFLFKESWCRFGAVWLCHLAGDGVAPKVLNAETS